MIPVFGPWTGQRHTCPSLSWFWIAFFFFLSSFCIGLDCQRVFLDDFVTPFFQHTPTSLSSCIFNQPYPCTVLYVRVCP